MTVFDQSGQNVENQTNVAGDLKQSGSGDTINMSGDFRGAMVNVKSTLNNVSQTINASSAEPALKDELNRLVEQLAEALQETPEDKVEEAEAVAQMAETVVTAATAEKPNKTMLQVSGEGLKQAAQNLAAVTPAVLAIATQIVAAVSKYIV